MKLAHFTSLRLGCDAKSRAAALTLARLAGLASVFPGPKRAARLLDSGNEFIIATQTERLCFLLTPSLLTQKFGSGYNPLK